MKYFKATFVSVLENSKHYSIDKHICKFKDKFGMNQYIKYKPIKWGLRY